MRLRIGDISANYLLATTNITVIIWYLWTGDFPGTVTTNVFYVVVGGITVLGIVELLNPYFRQSFSGIHLVIFSLLLTFAFFEIGGRVFYDLLPRQVTNYYDPDLENDPGGSVVEYLEESPFGKFKPNRIVTIPGDRGKDFVYQWKTDAQGFKNKTGLSQKDTLDLVAVGDSLTEGMGVSISDTWVSLLTDKGMTAYNLGVQGYAPMQMAGAFKRYGMNYRPKHVVIGYYAGKFVREGMFLGEESTSGKERGFTGGLENIRALEAMRGHEIRRKYRYFFSAIYALARSYIRGGSGAFCYESKRIDPPFDRYYVEIHSQDGVGQQKRVEEIERKGPEWVSTLQSFNQVKEMADVVGAKTTLVYFPSRGLIYYEAAMGEAIKGRTLEEVEIDEFEEFAAENKIHFVDLTPVLKKYVDELVDAEFNDISLLPYFMIDGHLSKIGNQLVANHLYNELVAYH